MPNVNSSSLALRRRQLGYGQKQIAVLLGHKTKYQICRYENGQRIPGLKTAIKLSILYGLPVRVLLEGYFCQCKRELESRLKQSGLESKINFENGRNTSHCTFLESMNSPAISDRDADSVRRHIKVLMEERSKRILGN